MKIFAHLPLATLLLAALAAGCGADAPRVEVPRDPNLVEVTFYRPHSDLHVADYPYVYVDKDRRDALADHASATLEVRSGMHRLSLKNPALWDAEQFFTFNAVPGRRYFFRLHLGEGESTEGWLPRYVSRFARIDEVPEAAARAEIAAMQAPAAK